MSGIDENLRLEKRRLRAVILERLSALTEKEIERQSAAVCKSITGSEAWEAADWVFCFLSMGAEIKTGGILEKALADGKDLGLPRLRGKAMDFHRVTDLAMDWDIHSYGMKEPPLTLPVLDPLKALAKAILVVTPGLGFSLNGARLGRGGGYYDRYFEYAKSSHLEAWAVAFNCQIIDGIPLEKHDRRMDGIATDKQNFVIAQ